MKNIKAFCIAAILRVKWIWKSKFGFVDFGKYRLYILDGKRLQMYYMHEGYEIDDRFKCSKKYKVTFGNLIKAVKEVMRWRGKI